MKHATYIIIAITLLIGCRTTPPVEVRERVVTKTETVERLRDTAIYLTDSATIQALIQCDSNGAAYIAEIQSLKLGMLAKPKVKIVNSVLTAECEVDSVAVYMTLRDRYTTVDSTSAIVRAKIVEVNRLTDWQIALTYIGKGCIALVFVVLLYFAVKKWTF